MKQIWFYLKKLTIKHNASYVCTLVLQWRTSHSLWSQRPVFYSEISFNSIIKKFYFNILDPEVWNESVRNM